MKILIISPSYNDNKSEHDFFNALQQVHAYKDNKVMGSHYLLELSKDFDMNTVKQLQQLFNVWQIDPSPLTTLAELASADSA